MMKTVVIFLLCATGPLRALAAPAEEAPVSLVEVKEEPKPEVKPEETHLPLVPKARGQFCLPDWESHGRSCYYVLNEYKTWKDAADFCAVYQGTLASVHDPVANNHLMRMAITVEHASVWIGGYHFENTWRWQDGSKFSFNKLESGEPTPKFKCLRMGTDEHSLWFDDLCTNSAPAICQVDMDC